MLQSAQIRAARALLGWRQEDLAKASEVGLATIARIEQGKGVVQGNFSTIVKIQQTLEREGISFIADPTGGIGVRLSAQKTLSIAGS
jgi:transcriptional regulator with XRE-family HTH domain